SQTGISQTCSPQAGTLQVCSSQASTSQAGISQASTLQTCSSHGKFPDSDFGSESLLAQLRENFCRVYIYIFSPYFVDITNVFTSLLLLLSNYYIRTLNKDF